ncbi:MAG: hypothetical protein GEU97_15675 [Actinophytocola sp.]|nr:hypothetical protein [Actinophytocola sp.]
MVLGLVTTKTPGLESTDSLLERTRDASRLIDRERLAVGTQCGFATSLRGNAISVDDERRKLELIVHAAKLAFWGVNA